MKMVCCLLCMYVARHPEHSLLLRLTAVAARVAELLDSAVGLSVQRAIFRLVLLELRELRREGLENVCHGRPQVAQVRDWPTADSKVSHRQGRDARLSPVSFIFFNMKRKTTYLNPADLMLHEINQEPLRYLTTPLLHPIQEFGLRRLQPPSAILFQRAANHLQPKRDAPEPPDIFGVDGELAARAQHSRLVLLRKRRRRL
jgi:hypothetical protein